MQSTSPESKILLDAYKSGGDILVLLKGRLVLTNCERVRKRLHELLSPEIAQIFLHLGQLEYVDSAGWGAMVGLKMAANRSRVRMCFLSPGERILDIFRISKLDSIFEIKSGAEAEVIRSEIESRSNLLWRDSPDETQNLFITEVSNLTPFALQTASGAESPRPEEIERRRSLQRLTRDAVEHLKHGRYEKVIEVYQRVLDVDPNDISALNNLAVVYERKPEWRDRALETWKRVVEVSESCNDLKHSERARRHLQALQQNPTP
jgi:anti-anti-sigma factor